MRPSPWTVHEALFARGIVVKDVSTRGKIIALHNAFQALEHQVQCYLHIKIQPILDSDEPIWESIVEQNLDQFR